MFPKIQNAFLGWQQNISLVKITQSIVDFESVNTKEIINFKGVIQPLTSESLTIKPLEERSFKWLQIHCFSGGNNLKVGEFIEYNGEEYKIKEKKDYSLNNYIEYHAIENFSNE